MPLLTYVVPNFIAFTKIRSADVNSRFNDIKTLLNTTGLDDVNVQNAGITRATKIKTGTANAIVYNNASGAMTDLAPGPAGGVLMGTGANAPAMVFLPNPINYGLSATATAGALTINLTTASGATPSTASPCIFPIRNNTITTGTLAYRSANAAVSLTLPSGSTLGMNNVRSYYLYVYAIDSDGAGTMQLGASMVAQDDGSLQTTTAVSAGSLTNYIIYSPGAYTTKPVRLIGRMKFTLATAGTWIAPTEISLIPFEIQDVTMRAEDISTFSIASANVVSTIGYPSLTIDTLNCFSSNTTFTVPKTGNYFVSCQTGTNASNTANAANPYKLAIYKNGSIYSVLSQGYTRSAGETFWVNGSDVVACTVGDTLTTTVVQTLQANPFFNGTAGYGHFSVFFIGS